MRNKPVMIWIIRHRPRIEPRFHHIEIFLGEGRSIKDEFIILRSGWDFRRGLNIKVKRT